MTWEERPPDNKNSNLSDCELLVECARNRQDERLWQDFYFRFRPRVVGYLRRAFRFFGCHSEDFGRHFEDLLQDVFTKLIQDDAAAIRSLSGSTDLSAYAFLASIATTTVADHLKFHGASRRRARTVPLEDLPQHELLHLKIDPKVSTALDLIDLERALREDEESKNPERDWLIFVLHFVEGLSPREINAMRAVKLTTSGLEKVLSRLRTRLTRKCR